MENRAVANDFSSFGSVAHELQERLKQRGITTGQEDITVRELKLRYPSYKFHPVELFEYGREQRNCRNCPGLENCTHPRPGYRKEVFEDEMHLNRPFREQPCANLLAVRKQIEVSKLIKSHHIPENVLNMTFETIERDDGRALAIVAALRFCTTFERGMTKHGLYLRGPFGVGKSAIGGAITQALAKRNIDVAMVYVTDYLSEVKSAIKTGNVEEKIDALKNVSVLILDDIGAEPLTQWTRDEVLGPILQARMEKLPTIYTSNLTLNDLERHLASTKDGDANFVKAARIMERIDPFVTVYEVQGPNRRRQKGE